MKNFTILGLAAISVSAFSTPGFAQEAEEMWEGGYVGASVGIGAQSNDRREQVAFDTNLDDVYGDTVRTGAGANAFSPGFCGGAANGRTPGEGCRSDKDGVEYYLRAGYDKQDGNIVYGVVIDGGTSNSRDSVTAYSTTPAFYTFTRELEYGFGARARLGYAKRGLLFYGTFGTAYGRIEQNFVTSNGANSFNGNSLTDRRKTDAWGWSAGGGAEAKLARNLSLGLEYLYTSYNDDDYTVRVGPGTAAPTNPFLLANPQGTNMRRTDKDFAAHNIRVTAAFRF